MRMLAVAAPDAEIAGIARAARGVEFLITGVGMVATAARTSRALARTRYDVALNVGVCGSFDRALAPGSVVHVVSDRIAELGAEDDDAFLTLDELALPGEQVFVNASPPDSAALKLLPAADGNTLNTGYGRQRAIAAAARRVPAAGRGRGGAPFL